jgi:hypothetical protein
LSGKTGEDQQMSSSGGEFEDLGRALWVPGVDYIGGWREAADVAAELVSALATAYPDEEEVTAVAQSAPDGSGIVHLRLPPATTRALAELIRARTAGRDGRLSAS